MKKFGISLLIAGIISVSAFAKGNDFIFSFGNGGLTSYKVQDNSCYVYVFNYPKNEKKISDIINRALMTSLLRAKKQFSKDNDGFINIKTHLKFIGKEKIIYQVCGDVIRRR
ncbi:hypothetical protein [Persephonella sp.]